MKKEEAERANLTYSYAELRNLDDRAKKDYVKKILEEDAQVTSYIKDIFEKIEVT